MSAEHIVPLLALLAEQSGEKVSPARLEFMAKSLIPLGPPAVLQALEKLLESARRFPTVAEVKAVMGLADPTARDVGNEIASVIIGAISRCGVPVGPKGQQALDDMLGPAAKLVVQKLGGWNLVVDQAEEGITNLRAQIRDIAEACVRTGQVDPADVPQSLPSYSEALAIAATKVDPPALPEPKRALLEEQKADLLKLRKQLETGEITNDEALELVELANQQLRIKQEDIPF